MKVRSLAVVSIAPLKALAVQLPQGHPLRAVLLVEPGEMPAEELCSKIGTWMRLLDAR